MLFFFQAEDGIRDVAVTGVQTCALPILSGSSSRSKPMGASNRPNARDHLLAVWGVQLTSRLSISVDDAPSSSAVVSCANRRSEEHTSELQSRLHLVCRLLLEKKHDSSSTES